MSDDHAPSSGGEGASDTRRVWTVVVPVVLLVAAVWLALFGGGDDRDVTIADASVEEHDHHDEGGDPGAGRDADDDGQDTHDVGPGAHDGHDHDAVDESPDAGFATDPQHGLVVGETASLADGAEVRVRSVMADAEPLPGSPPVGDGFTLHRADVEVCATTEEVLVDASLWFGYASDGSVRSSHMGVRDLRTMVLLPSRCQRGTVDLPVPAGETLDAVLLSEHGHHQVTTVARWDVAESSPQDLPPLSTDTPPGSLDIEERGPLPDGGWVEVYDIGLADGANAPEGMDVVQLHVERCSGSDGVPTGPGDWLLQTEDLRLFAPNTSTATYETVELQAKDCMRGTVDIAVPGSSRIVAILAAHAGSYEEARWIVDSDPRPARN